MKKRYDPRMHSAEHILNQTMDRMFNCGRCFSAHIEKKKSKCDYHFNKPLLEEEIQQIESLCVLFNIICVLFFKLLEVAGIGGLRRSDLIDVYL